jgi:CrcB protein
MRLLLLATAGGAIGAGARYLVNTAFARILGTAFPWATLSVNVVGSLLMGLVMALLARSFDGSPDLRTFLATGILGGFTTFSAFSFDVWTLLQRGEAMTAFVYVAGSVVVSIAALFAGVALARGLFS